MTSPEFYNTRSQLGCTEKSLYVCLRTPPHLTPRWFILRRAKTLDAAVHTLNQLIPIRSFPSQIPESASVVALDWGIYIIGGIIDDEYTSDVLILDCRNHTWLPVPSMGACRAFAAAGVLNGKIYVFGGCENPNSRNWGEVFDPKLQTWDTLPLPDWKICSNSIHQSLVIDEKVYAIDKFNRNFHYSLSEFKWDSNSVNLGLIRIPNDSEVESRRQWCVVEKLLYCCDHLWNLYWCEPKELDIHDTNEINWKQVKGLEALQWSFSGSRLSHFDEENGISRLNSFGKNVVLFWEVGLGDESLEIWCAEISLERHQGDEIWGKIEWSDVVMTLDPRSHSFELIYSLSVNV